MKSKVLKSVRAVIMAVLAFVMVLMPAKANAQETQYRSYSNLLSDFQGKVMTDSSGDVFTMEADIEISGYDLGGHRIVVQTKNVKVRDCKNLSCVEVYSDNAEIANCTITSKAAGKSALIAGNSKGLSVFDCTLTSDFWGVQILNCEDICVDNNTTNNTGIYIENTESLTLTNNKVNGGGIVLTGMFDAKVIDNSIVNAPHTALNIINCYFAEVYGTSVENAVASSDVSEVHGEGVIFQDCDGCTFSNSTINGVNSRLTDNGNGVIVAGGKDNTIKDCVITGAGNHGVQASYKTKNCSIKNNTISNSGRMGVSVSRESEAYVNNNEINNSNVNGIVFDGKSGKSYGSATGNTISNAKEFGIYAEASDLKAEGNIIHNTGKMGIAVTESGSLTANNNHIFNDARIDSDAAIGIGVYNRSVANINTNRIMNYGQSGIYATEDSIVEYKNNQVAVLGVTNINLNAYYHINVKYNQMFIRALDTTHVNGQTYYAGLECGAYFDGNMVKGTTDQTGGINLSYNAGASKIITVYVKDNEGNYIILNAPSVDFDINNPTGVSAESYDKIKAFVKRLYNLVMSRDPEDGGLKFWSDELAYKRRTGCDVVRDFFNSPEYKAKKLTHEEYLNILYRTLMGREADEGGMTYWLGRMHVGLSERYILAGFAYSPEFTGICNNYGIDRGGIQLSEYRDLNAKVTEFVSRIYYKALGRSYLDADGMNYWCGEIIKKARTPEAVVWNFVFSDEFEKKNLSDSAFVDVLYATYFDREADAGKDYWMGLLASGKTRQDVVKGFNASTEFRKLVDSYNIR
ncbi:MAG: DUF4214 domain-containing protein [Lachnospiraceae bacterium]|nr:DUF4214 domain-containing protein [Lachnospiraceae bacterium]